MKKLIFKILLLSIFILVLTKMVFDPIFNKNNSFRGSIEELYQFDIDSLDILIVGSSHARNTYNTEIIDKAIEVNSYSLASDGQKIAVSNNLLKDILKDTKPKLVILDLFSGSLDFPETEQQKSYQLRVFDNSKWSINKFKLVTSIYSKGEIPSVLSPTIRNHKNWPIANWTFNEFRLDSSLAFYNKGFAGYYTTIKDKDRADLIDYKRRKDKYLKFSENDINEAKLKGKLQELKKTIGICKQNNVELLLVSSPYFDAFYSREASDLHALIKEMCDEYDIRFLDFNTKFDELGLTLDDFRDRSHVNLAGADKVTSSLVTYLLDKQYFKIEPSKKANLFKTLKSLSNTFELYFEEELNKEIFPDIFVTQVSIYQSKNQRKIELILDKKEGVRELIANYNLEWVTFPLDEDLKLLQGDFKKYKRELQTFYTLKNISINGQHKISVIFPKSNISKYKKGRLFSFVKNKKSEHRYIIDFPNLDLSTVVESKHNHSQTSYVRDQLLKSHKVLSSFYDFSEDIKLDEITYQNVAPNEYEFLFNLNPSSDFERFEKLIGYIRYYDGDINEQNKRIHSFPLEIYKNNKGNYLRKRLSIPNPHISKLDVFFMVRNTKTASKFLTIRDLNLKEDKKSNRLNEDLVTTKELLSEPYDFNKDIRVENIAYQNFSEKEYKFLFEMNPEFNHNRLKDFTGYIRYYNGEIKDVNKKVKSFPLTVLENDGRRYIIAKINIANIEISKFDVFFIEKETKKVSEFFTLKDFKLNSSSD